MGGRAWGEGKRGHKLHQEHEEDKLAVVALAPACAQTHDEDRARTTRARGTRRGRHRNAHTRTSEREHEGALGKQTLDEGSRVQQREMGQEQDRAD